MNCRDTTAVTRWFLDYEDHIRKALRTRLSRIEEVDDLVQEVFLRLLRVPQPALVENPKAYVYRIALNIAQEWRQRAAQSLDHTATLDTLEAHEDPARETSALEQDAFIMQRLRTLPIAQRTAVILHVIEDMTCEQVADHMGTTRRAVKHYIANAYAALRCPAAGGEGAVCRPQALS